MPDESENGPKGEPETKPGRTESFEEIMMSFAKRTDQRLEKLEPLPADFRALSRYVDSRLEALDRKFETIALDVSMGRESRRRAAGVPPHRDPVRPETEAGDDGFSSYPWERKLATPRLS